MYKLLAMLMLIASFSLSAMRPEPSVSGRKVFITSKYDPRGIIMPVEKAEEIIEFRGKFDPKKDREFIQTNLSWEELKKKYLTVAQK